MNTKTCRMPGCNKPTEKLFCHPHWKKIPQPLRLAFVKEEDRAKKREAYQAILNWCKAQPVQYPEHQPNHFELHQTAPSDTTAHPMTPEKHNMFPKGRYGI